MTGAGEGTAPKRDSAWHNFRGRALGIMRVVERAHHPSRMVVDDLMSRWFAGRTFEWLDVGVVGMVDYERLRPKMAFRFTGADLSDSVIEDSRGYLRDPADDLVRWDLEDPPPDALRGRFDLVTLRHVLNHCAYYERPLEHGSASLRPGGRVVAVLHLALVEGTDQLRRHREWGIPGEVIGNRYGRERFFDFFGRTFVTELWVRVDDGVKPNDVVVGRKRVPGDAPSAPPSMHRLWVPQGRRGILSRMLARLRLALLLRSLYPR